MGVSIFVMPVTTWVRGQFRVGWGDGGQESPPRPRRSEEEAALVLEVLQDALETLLGVRASWDETAPVRAAVAMSVGGFARPFLRARSWAYRMSLPRLEDMESLQIWLPLSFDPVLRIELPIGDGREIALVSAPKLAEDLGRLLAQLSESPELAELPEGGALPPELADLVDEIRTTQGLRALALQGVEERLPVIVEP